MSQLLRCLEQVRGAGLAELRGFATYNIAPWASVRTQVMEPVLLEMIEIPAADATAWRVLGIATIVDDERMIQASSSTLLHDRVAAFAGGTCRVYVQNPNGTRGGVPVPMGAIVELMIEKIDGQRDTPRVFNARLRGPRYGNRTAGRPMDWSQPIGSSAPIGHAGLVGKRTLVDLGGVVWRFVENDRGEMQSIEESLMLDVESELVHKSHVGDFELHYAHRPGAPVRMLSLHVWTAARDRRLDYSSSYLGSTLCPVLYGIDERSDRLVLEIGKTGLDHKVHNLDYDDDADGYPFFCARFDLNGLRTPWWWEDACSARAKASAR